MGHGQRQACPGPALAVGSGPGLPEAEASHLKHRGHFLADASKGELQSVRQDALMAVKT